MVFMGLIKVDCEDYATLYEKLNFDFIRDIAPVASVMRFPLVVVVHPLVPVKTVPEFVACQGQSGQAQHGLRRYRGPSTRRG